jgi:hypothetical protein
MERRATVATNETNNQNTKRSPPTTDFDIEYAKLIAKQFPIYD